MAHFYKRQPETMVDLTPFELDALVAATDAVLKNGGIA